MIGYLLVTIYQTLTSSVRTRGGARVILSILSIWATQASVDIRCLPRAVPTRNHGISSSHGRKPTSKLIINGHDTVMRSIMTIPYRLYGIVDQ